MADRIDRYLEGTVDRAALSPEERVDADLVERVIQEVRAFVGTRPAPDLTAAVMSGIERSGAHSSHRPGAWARAVARLWAPQSVSFQFRPAYGLFAVVAVMALSALWALSGRGAGDDASTATRPAVFVQFRLEAPEASTVRLAGSFTDWRPDYELYQAASGIWTITLPLPPGVHDYSFIVDGQRWVPDPLAPAVDDGFGGINSRIALVSPEDSRL